MIAMKKKNNACNNWNRDISYLNNSTKILYTSLPTNSSLPFPSTLSTHDHCHSGIQLTLVAFLFSCFRPNIFMPKQNLIKFFSSCYQRKLRPMIPKSSYCANIYAVVLAAKPFQSTPPKLDDLAHIHIGLNTVNYPWLKPWASAETDSARLAPSLSIFSAALRSLSRTRPQCGQLCMRSESNLGTIAPHPEHI
jgi:hypothetical protein